MFAWTFVYPSGRKTSAFRPRISAREPDRAHPGASDGLDRSSSQDELYSECWRDAQRMQGGAVEASAFRPGRIVRAAAHIGCRTSSLSAGQVGTTSWSMA